MSNDSSLSMDALLSGDEVEALLALLSDIAQGHADDPGVRDAVGAAWALLSNRAASQGGYAHPPEGYYQRWLGRMQSRDRPWRRCNGTCIT